jgi:copper resistance protein C
MRKCYEPDTQGEQNMRTFKPIPLIAAATLAMSPVALYAHAKMVSSTPAANATVAKPAKIIMTFNEKLMGPTIKVALVMTAMPGMTDHPEMKIAATSQIGKDGKSVTLTPKRALVAGTYKVTWSAAGADMHKMAGSYSFKVK